MGSKSKSPRPIEGDPLNGCKKLAQMVFEPFEAFGIRGAGEGPGAKVKTARKIEGALHVNGIGDEPEGIFPKNRCGVLEVLPRILSAELHLDGRFGDPRDLSPLGRNLCFSAPRDHEFCCGVLTIEGDGCLKAALERRSRFATQNQAGRRRPGFLRIRPRPGGQGV